MVLGIVRKKCNGAASNESHEDVCFFFTVFFHFVANVVQVMVVTLEGTENGTKGFLFVGMWLLCRRCRDDCLGG